MVTPLALVQVAAVPFTATLRYTDGSLCALTYTSLGSSETPKEAMELFFDGKTFVPDEPVNLPAQSSVTVLVEPDATDWAEYGKAITSRPGDRA